jgi:peptidoglycan/LPS O-acetylase OafA/YrhL
MKHGENNFDAIRLLAAVAVIFNHSHALTNVAVPSLLENSVGAVSVKIFFIISGYLICSSWTVDSNPLRYLAKRSLRIFPALIVVVIFSAFIVGPIFTDMSLADYFTNKLTFQYFYNIALYPVYYLPGVFADNVYPSAINGALWSLPVEFSMYLILPCILSTGKFAKSRYFLPMAALALCAASLWFVRINPPPHHLIVYSTDWTSGLDVAPYFLLGASVRLMCWERYLDPVFALFFAGCAALFHPDSPLADEVLLYIMLPYIVLSLATCAHRWLKNFGRYGDISYGVYIYGFLVQQSVAHVTSNGLSAVGNTLVSLPIVMVLAWASWHWVEKPALSLKPNRRVAKHPGPGNEPVFNA